MARLFGVLSRHGDERAHRVTLLIMLAIDAAMILYPPFEAAADRLGLGHFWLFTKRLARYWISM